MAGYQPTPYCRTCQKRKPRSAFSGRVSTGGYWHLWPTCDDCRAKRAASLRPSPDLPGEAWRPVVGFEQTYTVSNYGRVRRITACAQSPAGRLLTQVLTRYGYYVVALYRRDGGRNYFVHRLIAAAFIGSLPDNLVVNHKDGCKTNNRPENLEIVTQGENNHHAHQSGLSNVVGEHNPQAKLTPAQVCAIRQDTRPLRACAEEYGVSTSCISAIRCGRIWRHVK